MRLSYQLLDCDICVILKYLILETGMLNEITTVKEIHNVEGLIQQIGIKWSDKAFSKFKVNLQYQF